MYRIWSKSGEQGNSWIKGTADVGGHANFRLVFEGVRGDGFQGDIALDDISFTDCHPGTIRSYDLFKSYTPEINNNLPAGAMPGPGGSNDLPSPRHH